MAISILKKAYRWHLRNIRNHIYNEKMATHDVKKRASNSSDLIIGPPMVFVGYIYGKLLHRGYRQSQELGRRERFMRFYGPVAYLISFFLVFVVFALVLSFVWAVVELTFGWTVGDAWAGVTLLAALAIAAVPHLHGRYLAKDDVRVTKELEELVTNPSVERVDLAFKNIDHHQERTKNSALKALATLFEGSPGKAIKYSSASAETIYSKLVQRLEAADRETEAELCLRSLAWLSRDHGHLPYHHAKQFSQLVKANNSSIQVNATLHLSEIEVI